MALLWFGVLLEVVRDRTPAYLVDLVVVARVSCALRHDESAHSLLGQLVMRVPSLHSVVLVDVLALQNVQVECRFGVFGDERNIGRERFMDFSIVYGPLGVGFIC